MSDMDETTISEGVEALGFVRVRPGDPDAYVAVYEHRAEVDGQPSSCRVILDIDECATEVRAYSGPMVLEWTATYTDGTPNAVILAAVRAAIRPAA